LTGKKNPIVPYFLETVGLKPEDGIHYAIVSHRDSDHYSGYKDVIDSGYDILVANYEAGSKKKETRSIRKRWLTPAKETTAGAVKRIPVGLQISLGDGAEAIVMAANGKIYGCSEIIKVSNENDRSVALLIRYGKFQFILDGDMGSGPETCTKHITKQKNVEEYLAKALIDMDLINDANGVDIMHVGHHGSESSTSAAYYNLVRPEVAIISVGPNQGRFRHPRKFVVESVLFGNSRPDCVTAPRVELLLQTDDGIQGQCDHCGTNIGISVGDICISTDGQTDYLIQFSNCLFKDTSREVESGVGWRCRFDEDALPAATGLQDCCQRIVVDEGERMAPRCP
jgi:beta-lactamase superfamily II metal-dependent hydrolase